MVPFNTADQIMSVSRPGFMETIKLLPLARRVGAYVYNEHLNGRTPVFDLSGITLSPPIPSPNAGVPLGGVGGGSIGRGVRGEFRRWSLYPGRYRHTVVEGDCFGFRVKGVGENDKAEACVLSTVPTGRLEKGYGRWNWGNKVDLDKRSTFAGLFPRSWSTYADPTNTQSGVTVVCKQISPFLPDNYSDSSLPCGVFEFEIENNGDADKEVSVMFNWENNDGGDEKDEKEHSDVESTLKGKAWGSRAVMSTFNASPSKVDGVHGSRDEDSTGEIKGVTMLHRRLRRIAYKSTETDSGSFEFTPTDAQMCSCAGPFGSKGYSDKHYVEQTGFAVGAIEGEGVTVTTVKGWDPENGAQGDGIWKQFVECGEFKGGVGGESGGKKAAVVCGKVKVGKGERKKIVFSLSWDNGEAAFGSGEKHPRRHSLFFPPTKSPVGSLSNAAAISTVALRKHKVWDAGISAWQKPYIEDPELPEWFKGQLMNELYYLVDGGGVWVDSTDGKVNEREGGGKDPYLFESKGMKRGADELDAGDVTVDIGDVDGLVKAAMGMMEQHKLGSGRGDQSSVGTFLYLEGHEYVMYNTSDVHFYASFALSRLMPELQRSIMRDFARSVFKTDTEVRTLLGEGEKAPRKVQGAVVHDLGSPSESPVNKVNAYNFQDVSRWKDLPSKFVLMAVRDAQGMREEDKKDFVEAVWPACELAVERAAEMWDTQGDGMIKNEGFPDQTYDVWIADGVSTYTGGLWVAALFGMAKLAEVVGEEGKAKGYVERGRRARKVYNDRLWNGEYFSYSEKGKRTKANCDSVMADQMCGQWWSRVCGLEEVVESERVVSSLKKVHEMNVVRWGEVSGLGRNGAVNGMKLDGTVDDSCLQSKEVWTGTTYAVASAMLHQAKVEGVKEEDRKWLREAAFDTAKGIWEAGWKR
ncbi:hypothetical protein TrRE_jg11970 [Triparma retinervis]|uniref:Non-lysosomal glucosylceramidase n=1 Tax=Triparma retinervis TaxID=2557542 RepID=A0A9W7DS04_9STRA|nr:hypothetical protein TrRE_jg11970 [Triparma retinervis]